MDIIALKNHIIKNELKNVYVFTGTEIGIQNIYINQIGKVKNLPIIREENVVNVYRKCTVKSMFGNIDALYVVRGDTDVFKQEQFYENLSNDIGNNMIILLYDKLDSRSKFTKFFKEDTIQFDPLTHSILIKYILKNSSLTNSGAEKLSNEVANSYDIAMLEINKIDNYSQVTGLSHDKSLDRLLREGVIYHPQEYDVFQFADSVCMRKKASFEIAKSLLDNGVSSVVALGTLYNTMKNVLLVQCCEGSHISNITGLDSKQIYFAKKYVNKYRTDRLVYAVKLISKTVTDIKSGKIDDKIALLYVMVKIM